MIFYPYLCRANECGTFSHLACCSFTSLIILIHPNICPPRLRKKPRCATTKRDAPGKIAIVPTKPHSSAYDLSLAYSPGVAEPCLAIAEDPSAAYRYTAKGNLVGVISNGTAVLGLGNIGADARSPSWRARHWLFKIYSV